MGAFHVHTQYTIRLPYSKSPDNVASPNCASTTVTYHHFHAAAIKNSLGVEPLKLGIAPISCFRTLFLLASVMLPSADPVLD